MNQPEFGSKVAEIRKARGLTQAELAEKCDLSYRTIQRIESGMVTPRGFTMKTLSAVLEFDFLKVFYGNQAKKEGTDSNRFMWVQNLMKQAIELCNLKTHAMKKLSILTVILGLMGYGLFSVTDTSVEQKESKYTNFLTTESEEGITKEEAIKRIGRINQMAVHHNAPIEILKSYAEKSDYNHDSFLLIARLIGSFGHATVPAMEMAQILFFAQKDCPIIDDIVPLLFLHTGVRTDKLVALAKSAEQAGTDQEKKRVRKEIEAYNAKAKYKTLDEAFRAQ